MSRFKLYSLAAVLIWAGAAWAQTETATRPAPGEEVMRPTQRGLRLSPAMARAMARLAMREDYCKDAAITEEQERQIADSTSRRAMEIAHKYGREVGPALEYVFATMMASDGKVSAKNAREFGEQMQPLMRAGRELFDGLAEDARPVLDDEQFKQFEQKLNRHRREFERLEQRLAGYREGQVPADSEEPFDHLDRPEDAPKESEAERRVAQARNNAEWSTRGPTAWEWSRFLAGAVLAFKFDADQKAKGQALLAEYRKRADALRTEEWKAKIKRNRTIYFLQWELENTQREPWTWRLDKEYQQLMKPLSDLGREFQNAVLALATPQQQAEAVEAARQLGEKCGYAATETDLALLRGVLQPAAAPGEHEPKEQ